MVKFDIINIMLKDIIKNNKSYYWKKLNNKIRKDTYFYESFSGAKISGEIYFAILDIALNNPKIKIVAVINNFKDIPLDIKSLKNVKFVKRDSRTYMKYLAVSKMLFTDTSFPYYFLKRNDQILTQF